MAGALAAAGVDVDISWREWPAGTTTDPVTQSRTGPTVNGVVQGPVSKSQVVRGLVHFPEPGANSAVRQFNEVEVGDAIVDFPPDLVLEGKDNLQFVFLDRTGNPIDGQVWVAKPISETLARTWGALVGGQRIWRTVLLRKAT
jgi:hypothetical protein